MGDTRQPSSSPFSSAEEKDNWGKLTTLLAASPLGAELAANLPLYMPRQVVMRQLFMKELYEQILNTHGVIMELGCRWGTNLATFVALRGFLEPFNHNRKIIGFDTFEGLRGVSGKDGGGTLAKEGAYGTGDDYEHHLFQVLQCLEAECPIAHMRKFELLKGDVRETLPHFLADNPQTVVALAYLDMDIYEPTKTALEKLAPHLTRGSILAFDEMNWSELPGPTLALKDVFGLGKYRIRRSPLQPIPGYVIID